ncbi:hypothetical protein ACPC54_11080 [Kitasatospora sp. NPDC094028]
MLYAAYDLYILYTRVEENRNGPAPDPRRETAAGNRQADLSVQNWQRRNRR